jgi:hypothetical protein
VQGQVGAGSEPHVGSGGGVALQVCAGAGGAVLGGMHACGGGAAGGERGGEGAVRCSAHPNPAQGCGSLCPSSNNSATHPHHVA